MRNVYRAWCPDDKVMYFVLKLPLTSFEERGTVIPYSCRNNGIENKTEIDFGGSVGYSPLIVMQSTRVFDQDKNEIFQNDILEFQAPFVEKKGFYTLRTSQTVKDYVKIKAVPGGFVAIRKCYWGRADEDDMGEPLAGLQLKSWIATSAKIVGNMYENEELLN